MQLKTQTRGSFNVTEARTIVVVLEETEVEVEVEVEVVDAVVLQETEVEAEVGIEINALVMETVQGVVGSQESAAECARTLQAAPTRRVLEHVLLAVEEGKEEHVEG